MAEVMSESSMMKLAQEGDFRALAYWLNMQLVPQGIYTRVAADRPGCVLVLVEFLRMPQSDRLNRFVCHRLCQLNSPIIKGVRVIARFLGTSELLWDRSIRLYTPANGQKRPHLRQEKRSVKSSRWNKSRAIAPQSSHLLSHSSSSHSSSSHSIVHRVLTQVASLGDHPGRMNRSQILLLSSSAAAAFLLGVGSEALVHSPLGGAGRSVATRPAHVHTAEGNVRVIQTQTSAATATAPVTLAFGNPTALLTPAATATALSTTAEEAPSLSAPQSTTPSQPAVLSSDIALTYLSSELSALAVQAPVDGDAARSNTVPHSGLSLSTATAEGLSQTLTTLDQSGLQPLGVGRNAGEARRPEIVDVRGERIAYLSYTDSATQAAGFWKAGTNPAIADRIAEDIQALRSQVDWVVVNYHWNQPLASYPSDHQMQLSRFAVDQGADLVVGYHPEVLQGAEIYKGRAIAYSLGDFVFPTQSQTTKTDYETAMLKVAIKDKQMRVEFLPVEVKQAQAAIASPQKRQQILSYLQKASALFQQPLNSPAILERQQPAPALAPTPAPAAQENYSPPIPAAPESLDSTLSSPDKATPDSTTPDSATPTPAPAKPSNSFVAPADPAAIETTPTDSFIRKPEPPSRSSDATIPSPSSPVATPELDSEAIAPISTPQASPEPPPLTKQSNEKPDDAFIPSPEASPFTGALSTDETPAGEVPADAAAPLTSAEDSHPE